MDQLIHEDTPDEGETFIWWTNQQELSAMEFGLRIPQPIPTYLNEAAGRRVYMSRGMQIIGFQGRVSTVQEIEETMREKPALRLCRDRVGIMLRHEDIKHVFDLPGFLTDTDYNFVNFRPREPQYEAYG